MDKKNWSRLKVSLHDLSKKRCVQSEIENTYKTLLDHLYMNAQGDMTLSHFLGRTSKKMTPYEYLAICDIEL